MQLKSRCFSMNRRAALPDHCKLQFSPHLAVRELVYLLSCNAHGPLMQLLCPQRSGYPTIPLHPRVMNSHIDHLCCSSRPSWAHLVHSKRHLQWVSRRVAFVTAPGDTAGVWGGFSGVIGAHVDCPLRQGLRLRTRGGSLRNSRLSVGRCIHHFCAAYPNCSVSSQSSPSLDEQWQVGLQRATFPC